jgi:hypothetical protein
MASKITIEPAPKVEICTGQTFFNPKSRSHQSIGFDIASNEKGIVELVFDDYISPRERNVMTAAAKSETSRLKLIKRLENKLAVKKIAASIARSESK